MAPGRGVHGDAGGRRRRALERRRTAFVVGSTAAFVRAKVEAFPVEQAVAADTNALEHDFLHKGWDDGKGRLKDLDLELVRTSLDRNSVIERHRD